MDLCDKAAIVAQAVSLRANIVDFLGCDHSGSLDEVLPRPDGAIQCRAFGVQAAGAQAVTRWIYGTAGLTNPFVPESPREPMLDWQLEALVQSQIALKGLESLSVYR